MFDPSMPLPALEAHVLELWDRTGAFEASLDPSRPLWSFLEGPPTMNGDPGVHHAEPRAFKDVFCRFKTMTGYYVPRQAGWDCHGLPVELSVAADHGLRGPADVERFGLTRFVDECRASVTRHEARFVEFTRRLGFWLDTTKPYRTMDSDYVQRVWAFLAAQFDAGRLFEDSRVTPWCTSCATALSSHEVAQGFTTATTLSVTVRLPLVGRRGSLLVWTTTPWTLPENVLVGVDPDAWYVEVESGQGVVVTSRVSAPPGAVLSTFRGSELVGARYLPPFGDGAHQVVSAPVDAGSGTGLVHLAPAYGLDDQTLARAHGLDRMPDLGPDGVFAAGQFEGVHYLELSARMPELLGDLLFSSAAVTHSVPACWRCASPLVHLARPCWYLATTEVAADMLAENEGVEWFPPAAGTARYASWLASNVDWSVSRERTWGTPLPLWRCPAGHTRAVGSLAELGDLTGSDLSALDPHRPYVDSVAFTCECGQPMRRLPLVVDCWLDSGLAPRATTADLVAEGVDQTRGWFYSLQAVARLSDRPSAYRRVMALGHVVDANGVKMGKSKGNALDPFELFDEFGADAVRWQLLTDGSPYQARRLSPGTVRSASGTLNRLRSVAAFLPPGQDLTLLAVHPLDVWLERRAAQAAGAVAAALGAFDTALAGQHLTELVDDLSVRYLKLSRTRGDDPAMRSALARTLKVTATLMAPLVPFVAEGLWLALGLPGSVHHQAWPVLPHQPDALDVEVSELLSLLELGRAQRSAAGVRQRQPLAQAWVTASLRAELLGVLRTGLNVSALTLTQASWRVRPNWRVLGRRHGAGASSLAAQLPPVVKRADVLAFADGTPVTDEAVLEPLEPLRFDFELTPDLVLTGRLADLHRQVTSARKEAGLLPGDRVSVTFDDPVDQQLALERCDEFDARNTSVTGNGRLRLAAPGA